MALIQFIQNEDQNQRRRPRIFRDRTNPLDVYDDVDILLRFRMTRETIFEVIDLVRADLEHPTERNHAIPATLQTLCALRYYATGNFQKVSGDLIGISQPSVSRIVDRVSRALCAKAAQVIRFPSTRDEEREVIERFYERTQFPGVIGCVDESLIRIKSPPDNEHIYVCRKNFHALNVQGICDHHKKFTNIVARWPGSTHDSFIWNNCALSRHFEDGNGGGHLLGDSAYPLRPWLLTPICDARNAAEERYNRCHGTTRQCIEGTFGLWKMRWMVIHDFGGAMTLRPSRCIRVIIATAMLHNICQDRGVPLPPGVPENRADNPDIDTNPPLPDSDLNNAGRLARDALVRGHFTR